MIKWFQLDRTTIFLITFFSIPLGANEFNDRYNHASELYENRNYLRAIEELTTVAEIVEDQQTEFYFGIEDVYYKLGICYLRTENYEKATIYFRKVLDAKNEDYYCKTYISLGNIYINLSDYTKAINYFEQSKYYLLKNNQSNSDLAWYIYNSLGVFFHESGNTLKAIENYKESIKIAKRNNPKRIAHSYLNIAIAYASIEDIYNAYFNYNLALNEFKKDSVQNRSRIALTQMNYGRYCVRTGNTGKGLSLLNKALITFSSTYGKKHPLIASSYHLLGNSFLDNNIHKALKYYQKAIIAKVLTFNDTALDANPQPESVLPDKYILKFLKAKSKALIKLAEKQNKQENSRIALSTLELTVKIIENVHKGFQYEKSRLELLENEHSTFNDIITVSMQLYELTGNEIYKRKAFEYSEKSRYATLKSQMNDVQLSGSAGIPDSLQQKEKDIRIKINQYRSQISDETDSPELAKLNRKLFECYEEQDRLTSYFENNYPKYHKLKYANELLGIEEIQNKLSRKEALIEYYMGDTALITFVLTKTEFEVFQHKVDSAFGLAYKNIEDELVREQLLRISHEEYFAYIDNAFYLYSTLIQPIESLIRSKRLIIIPDQSLSFIPIGTLISEKPEKKTHRYHELKYLIRKYAISYAFSANLLSNNSSRKWNNRLAAFSPGKDVNTLLIHSKDEVNSLSKHFRSTLFLDSAATKRNFTESLENYDIVHLSMHGRSDSLNENINLIFEPSSDSNDDGKLNYIDVYNFTSNNSLISLGACKSGSGKVVKGEGVLSLVRSFHFAGCSASITSLWVLNDFTSSKILPKFYKHLSHGKRKDIALRKAKLAYIKANKGNIGYPASWGGIVCIGNTRPIAYPKAWIYVTICSLVVISVIVWQKTRKG